MMQKAIYAGSFDPITNGHLWIIEKAINLFDYLVIAVGNNTDKVCTFSIAERIDLIKQTTKQFKNIIVTELKDEFLVHYAKKLEAKFIVRGIRNGNDYEYERNMRYINSDLDSNITTIFLIPPRNFVEVSSNTVKNLIGPIGWEQIVKQYVPSIVFTQLQQYHMNHNV